MDASAPDASPPWRAPALGLLALAGASAAGALAVDATRGALLASFFWRAAGALLAPGLALLLLSLASRRRRRPVPLASGAVAALAGAWAGALLWALAAPSLRLPWPPTLLGAALNLAMLVASPLAAWHDRPEGWLFLAGGAMAGAVALAAARHWRRRSRA